jgi:hypothetical protein
MNVEYPSFYFAVNFINIGVRINKRDVWDLCLRKTRFHDFVHIYRTLKRCRVNIRNRVVIFLTPASLVLLSTFPFNVQTSCRILLSQTRNPWLDIFRLFRIRVLFFSTSFIMPCIVYKTLSDIIPPRFKCSLQLLQIISFIQHSTILIALTSVSMNNNRHSTHIT